MENKTEKIFVDGFIAKKPKEGTPDFVKLNFSWKVEEFIAFLQKHNNNGWVNADFKVSKAGKLYTELNTWKPKQTTQNEGEIVAEDINL